MLAPRVELADGVVPKLLDQVFLLGEQARQLVHGEPLGEETTRAASVDVHLTRLSTELARDERRPLLKLIRTLGSNNRQQPPISVLAQCLTKYFVDVVVHEPVSDRQDEPRRLDCPAPELVREEEERIDVLQLVGGSEYQCHPIVGDLRGRIRIADRPVLRDRPIERTWDEDHFPFWLPAESIVTTTRRTASPIPSHDRGLGRRRHVRARRESHRRCRLLLERGVTLEHAHCAGWRRSRLRAQWMDDRGMLTEARIREEVAPAGLDWITTLRAPAIRELVSGGAVQRSMFDDTDLAEIRSDVYPGERLIVCRNERLAEERAHKREALLQATEALLAPIVAATVREKRRLKGQAKIALRVGKVIGKYKMAKHFELDITETAFTWRRNADAIAAEATLDGLYIVRTSVSATELDTEQTVRAYKGLSVVERAFRSLKTVDLKVRPIYHYAASRARVRAHVFLCMLAYYVEWHMRQRLKPLLFDDEEPQAAQAARASVVARAEVSPCAQDKARSKRTASGESVHSLRTLLDDLATIAKNRVVAPLADAEPFDLITRPTALQRKAFKLLGVRLERTQ